VKYTRRAIPTTYAGVNFRSRLEARWAAFFDLCGWRWQYEPIDLAGWIPDFVLLSDVQKPVLVECKPLIGTFEPGETGEKMEAACRGTEWEGRELLLVGAGLWEAERPYDRLALGLIAEATSDGLWWQAALVGGFHENGRIDFTPDTGWYEGRLFGAHYKCPGGDCNLNDYLASIWNKAGNKTQWKPAA
jgi:hypothetical protein